MSAFVMTDCEIWADDYNLTSVANSVEASVESEEVDVTTFGSNGDRRFIGGLKQAQLQVMTFTDYTVDAKGLDGEANVVLTFVGEGNDQGNTSLTIPGLSTAVTEGGAVGEARKTDLTFRGTGQPLFGKLLQPKITRTASGSSAALQLGAVPAGKKVYLACHVLAASGSTPTLTIKLQSGTTSGGATTDRITSSEFTGTGVELKALAGPVTDTWWRINATIGGAGPSFTLACTVAIA
jgi:hypothetical protein